MQESESVRVPELGELAADGGSNDATPDAARPELDVWPQSGAVCCSGGGIRSASYCLGALQALHAAGVRPKLITAVSGGSYIAAGWVLASQGFDPALGPPPRSPADAARKDQWPRREAKPPYQPGSAEEHHLRTHTRYIAPNVRIGLIGVASLVVGALITVGLIASLLFVFGQVWGALLAPGHLHVLSGLDTGGPTASVGRWTWWIWSAAAGGMAALLFVFVGIPGSVGAGLERGPSLVGIKAGGVAVLLSIAMLLIPLAVAGLFRFGLYDGGAGGTIVRGLGFASTASCKSAYRAQATLRTPEHDTVCGEEVVRTTPPPFGHQSGNPWPRLIAFFVAVAGLAKSAVGRWSSATKGGTGTSWIRGLTRVIRRFIAPWLGTIVIVLAFAVVTLRWTADGALHGFRWWVPLFLLAPFVGRLFLDVNRMSLHDFYRWRLSEAYGYSKKLAEQPSAPSDQKKRARAIKLSDLQDGPMLAICTAANADARGDTPAGLDAFLLRFDQEQATLYGPPKAGKELVVRARTKDYETLAGLTLFDLVAISGAAFSPLMGKATRQAMRILLTVANARLGVWLPNPAVVHDARTWVDKHSFHPFPADQRPEDPCTDCGHPKDFSAHGEPCGTNLNWDDHTRLGRKPRWPLPAVVSHLILGKKDAGDLWGHVLWYQERANANRAGSRSMRARILWRAMQPTLGLLWKEAVASSGYRQEWVYASDGGHYENLGLVAALHDESIRTVVALDASGDKTDTWNTVGQAIALARTDAGVAIDLDPSVMTAASGDGPNYVRQPFATGTFSRGRLLPPSQRAFLLTCKLGVWKGAPWDVRSYAATHPAFPCTSTGQQLYDGDEFEAYRALGWAAVDDAGPAPPRARAAALITAAKAAATTT